MLPTDHKPEIGPEGRVCRACKTWKPWDEFHKKGNGVYGRHSQCRTCSIKKMEQRRKRNKPQSLKVIDIRDCELVEQRSHDERMNSEFEKLIANLVYDTVFNIEGGKNE